MSVLISQSVINYVEEENIPALKALLEKCKDVDERNECGQTPLMIAAEQGNLEIVKELIKNGANCNLEDLDNWTALISASKEGHIHIVEELLKCGVNLEHRDMGGWTALMWACYKGRTEVVELLLSHGANPSVTGLYSVYPIIWAAGRGHADIVHLLLQNGAKVNCSDKYGTTPLVWAARKGHLECVKHLLAMGADVDQEGANSMTALIVAVKGGYTQSVKEILKRNPNVNLTDKDGNTALMIASKEGHTEIVQDLLDAGTYVNIPDRSGDTVLIGAVRGGHVEIVRALLQKYADIDIRGQDNKTALYWAVEKGNATMVRDILQCNPDTEICTKDGETPLIKATKMRNIEVVELLLDKGAKVSAVDKKGDTPLHIAIRGRSRKLAELLLRNPKDGRLLYRPNKAGETPYNIDCSHQKSILTQIFGARHLSPTETDGDMLGYDLYSSALADILSEPTMQPPICVGLYAQWGSGKSFLLKKLEDEMKTFAGQQIEPLFQFSWLIVFLTVLLCGGIGLLFAFTVDPNLGIAVSLSFLALLYIFFIVIYFGGRREGESWNWAWVLSTRLARHIGYLQLLLRLMFVNPPELPEQTTKALPVRFLFTDYNRLSSVGGETSLAEMIATLSDACEREFGFLATRLFRVFKTEDTQGKKKWKKTCCLPSFVIFLFIIGCIIAGITLLAIFRVDTKHLTVNAVLISIASVVGLAFVLNCRTWWQVLDSLLNSQRKRLHNAASKLHKLKSEGFMKVLKCEVELMARMAKTIDSFTQNQTRLVVIIDGLDACEQDKVLQMLDTVRVLFSKGPFIAIFASDPHIIIKAINQNLNSVLRDSNINGHDYMRNIVHLPVFLNSRGLSNARKYLVTSTTNGDVPCSDTAGIQEDADRRVSQNSLGEMTKLGSKTALNRRDTYRRRQMQRTVTRQMSFDLTKLLVTEDWFSDISPQTMRRLLNIVSVTGRLLRANQITFNWDRLASWINLTEQWPYRTSWLILYLEETEGIPDQMTLKTIYERISKNIPTTKDVEPLLEIDGDIRNFEVFLSSRTPVLVARDVKTFLPCTVNLDPKLREIIADVRAAREQISMGGLAYPPLPLHEAAPRAPSGYSQPPSVCSSSTSFNGPFTGGVVSPQPHSSYYSGMTGPQHPFYNRPFFAPYLYTPRYYPGGSQHLISRPSVKTTLPRDQNNGLPCDSGFNKQRQGSGPASGPLISLNSMNVDAVCEKLKQIEGLDQSMLPQYCATIKKANINGRVLAQCNIDELKKEMNMNFGDWHLFRSTVLEMRNAENQVVPEDPRFLNENPSSSVPHADSARRSSHNELPHTELSNQTPYTLNFSFEELNTLGLDEGAARHSNLSWQSQTRRTPSLSSLNSQDSSIEISKLTDKVQAEYRDAYREYIAQMSQLEGGTGSATISGRSSPHSAYYMGPSSSGGSIHSNLEQEKGKDSEPKQDDGRKSFLMKRGDVIDYSSSGVSTSDASPLDPITEEDEKSDQSGSKLLPGKKSSERSSLFQTDLKLKGSGLRYQKLPSDEDESGTEESDNTPLLKDDKDKKAEGKVERASKSPEHSAEPIRTFIKAKEYLSDALLDKKDSSDSGVRSNESSPNHSLHNEAADDSQLEKANLIELEDEGHSGKRGIPHSLSGLQDPIIARMSICSEDKKSPSECSLIASSPEENWPTCQKAYNLNRTPSTVTLNNNSAPANRANQNFDEMEGIRENSQVILRPGCSSNPTAIQNENLKSMAHKRSQRSSYTRLSKESAELQAVASSDSTGFGEERESIL
ncbi:PREDICTED: kinase D-interacting substrate of 220 kDa isoform X1 [Galeopterus variegatus]|uniref:Kinase D-interacting substrate of 220 kDa isoform X1 n=1 Tax=Galeopterus variegatus TaxID=482537 RepID=A0ABM0SFV8_GALVR|nr:PREDICTED: kinase D-interacting substrate of 220 kDa isoform X1 [Galeopterus variegatus]XP_008591741.1 PREDICTED: kinase D-interacting substrate of 220 kDa isoform X1 [Galeopterus variegatus]XP_008591749.1 PREDICTED: kinase D-interacting substrate of 220 kDa isoform X1 [Galeopterus variegatus]